MTRDERRQLARTLASTIALTGSYEHIEERISAVGLGADLSSDRFNVLRFGLNASQRTIWGGAWSGDVQVSQGIAGLDSRTAAAAAASGVPFSRQGAGPGFTKLNLDGSFLQPLPACSERNTG